MTKWPLIGNQHITKYLERSIVNNKISNAYVFSGADDLGKTTLASFFAKLLLCANSQKAPCGYCPTCKAFDNTDSIHPDLHVVKKESDKKNISIKQIRTFIKSMSLSSFVSKRKVGIIKHADTMSIEAHNAMLKTLEEARHGMVIILVVNEIDTVPETVISRCQVLNFRSVCFDEIYDDLTREKNVSRNSARDYAKICLGRPALALKFLDDNDFYKKYLDRVEVFMHFFEQNLNGRFSAVNRLLGSDKGQVAATNAKRILNAWGGVVRDLLLLRMNNAELIQHQAVVNHVNSGDFKIPSYGKILSAYKRIKQAEDYLIYNINPKSALEGVVMGVF
jgi:DNA polymerase III subunit delta'